MVRPVDHDYMDDLPSYSGAGHNDYPAEYDMQDEPTITTTERIKLDLNKVAYLAEALIWCEDSPKVQAALNDLAVTRERLQAELQQSVEADEIEERMRQSVARLDDPRRSYYNGER